MHPTPVFTMTCTGIVIVLFTFFFVKHDNSDRQADPQQRILVYVLAIYTILSVQTLRDFHFLNNKTYVSETHKRYPCFLMDYLPLE